MSVHWAADDPDDTDRDDCEPVWEPVRRPNVTDLPDISEWDGTMPDTTPKMIRAPWTPEQVEALNACQNSGSIHPFTCAGDHDDNRVLVAHTDGWRCPSPGCDYLQDWTYGFMADEPASAALGRVSFMDAVEIATEEEVAGPDPAEPEPADLADAIASLRAELADMTRKRDEWKWRAEDAQRQTRCQRERAEQAETALSRAREAHRRLAAHLVGFADVLDDIDRGPWAKTGAVALADLDRALKTTQGSSQ